MKFRTILFFVIIIITKLSAQEHHFRFENIDVQHYVFEIHLNDSTNTIEGKTTASIKLLKPGNKIILDLIGKNDSTKTGMSITSILFNGKPVQFKHINNQLEIDFNAEITPDIAIKIEINYAGIPADGLIISKNKYGDRTFFGDNWPDRARHWLPTVDHPSDKATLEFLVYAPNNYKVVSNGSLQIEKYLSNNQKLTHWKEDVPISTKLMVIGVADFIVGNKTEYEDIPVSSWLFPQNEKKGLENYKFGTKALEYFSELFGLYSYEKLAHVQSKTRYGGMENASCIFYNENTGFSKKSQERLFAHEVAHQWFGNSVTEQNWHHVWLSEGFATYLTHVYKQHFWGEEVFQEGLKNDRDKVVRYAKRNLTAIIDTTITEYIRLLNTNSYQKAGWFLHMLRGELGDEIFFNGLRKYYSDFQNSTALTKDFQNVMEEVSGKNLESFFLQWLWQPGHPILEWDWKQLSGNLNISIKQVHKESSFDFPLKIRIVYEDGNSEFLQYNSMGTTLNITTQTIGKVKNVILDPETKLLFEEVQ